MEDAFERKREKYDGLVKDCHKQGWKARCFPVEVRCRDFAGQSLCRAYAALSITGEKRRRAIQNNTEAAERASGWLWIKRMDSWGTAVRAEAEVGSPPAGSPGQGCMKHPITPGNIIDDLP